MTDKIEREGDVTAVAGADDGAAADTSRYLVRGIQRAADVLERIRLSRGGISLTELVEQSGLTKPTVFRMVKNLEHIGLVERVPGQERYRLGLRCIELGKAYLEQIDYRREADPVLKRLRDEYDETVHLAVLDDDLALVYVDKIEGRHAIGIMMSRVGGIAPSYCTGLGKALLAVASTDPVTRLEREGRLVRKTPATICDPDALRAELALIRARGYSLDLEEHEPGVRCVASTITDASGRAVAALSIAGPAQRLPESELHGPLAEATMAAAREISRRLGADESEAD